MRRYLTGLAIVGALLLAPAHAQLLEDVVFAYPNVALAFSAAYLGEDLGLFAKHGLRVTSVIADPRITDAVMSGRADFAFAPAVVLTRAARGQRLLAIANLLDRPVVHIVLRKELAPNFNARTPLNDRVRFLKDRTIAVDAIGSIPHGYPLLLARRAGLYANDLRISAMTPSAALAAFKARRIDGLAMSIPWPIGPMLDGEAVLIASGPDGDPPDVAPFGMAMVITRPQTCENRKSVCEKMGRAMVEAVKYLRDNPMETGTLLKKRFATLDHKVFVAGFEQIRKATPVLPVTLRAALENGERYNIEAGFLKAEDKLKSYEGLYTDAYVK